MHASYLGDINIIVQDLEVQFLEEVVTSKGDVNKLYS